MQLTLSNRAGQALAAVIDMPTRPVRGTALLAHCFTCGKDLRGAREIARALTAAGIAAVRFDFAGLGRSEGDFAQTSFSANVDDLIDVAGQLPESLPAPALLIGHSLGGAAVLAAAHRLPSVKAVATIGAPSVAAHVEHLFAGAREAIERDGQAPVRIGDREINIGRSLLDDLNRYTDTAEIGKLRRALLVMHAPLDKIVNIDEASAIFSAAKHPKSFVSLDNADHLLSDPADARFAGQVIGAWAEKYLPTADNPAVEEGTVRVGELDERFLRAMSTASHTVIADEPKSVGGGNAGPTPYDLLLMSLGACTSMTLRMYANRKRWDLGEISVDLKHERVHAQDAADSGQVEVLTRSLSTEKPVTDEQREALLRIADRCPVHRTLESHPVIETQWSER